MSMAREGLADVVDVARKSGLMAVLACALGVRRQTIYLWERRDGEGVSALIAEARLNQIAKLDLKIVPHELREVIDTARLKVAQFQVQL